MKKLLFSILVLNFTYGFGQSYLFKDLNPGSGDGIRNFREGSAKLGDILIFAADNGTSGSELYKIEDDEVVIIKDIVVGSDESDPSNFINYNNKVYFSAQNAQGTYDLYETDGTSNGTKVFASLGLNNHIYEFFLADNGKLYFNGDLKLYFTDGNTVTELIIDKSIDFDNSWTYASTNIDNYKLGVVFSGKSSDLFSIYYHDGNSVQTLHTLDLNTFSKIIGPVSTSLGVVFGVQDSFNDELIKTYFIASSDNSITELKLDSESIDLQRIYAVNGNYCLIKPFGEGFYTFNGSTLEYLSGPGDYLSLAQGERLPYAVSGDKLFYLGEQNWFDRQYYITDGSANGTNEVETPEEPYPGDIIITEGNIVYMSQGTSNGFDATIVKIDLTSETSETIYRSNSGSDVANILGIVGDDVYFSSTRNAQVGREIYIVGDKLNETEYLFPKSDDVVLTSCDTTIFDDGGSMLNYSNNVDGSILIKPSKPNSSISLEFISFDLESGYDYLDIINDGLSETFTGSTIPNITTSNDIDGSIDLYFYSDFTTNKSGFEIKVTCVNDIKGDEFLFPISGSVELNSCDTTIFDDGGSLGNYGDDVDGVLVIKPSELNSSVSLEFISFDLEQGNDFLNIINDKVEENYTGNILPSKIISSSTDGQLELNFTTDAGFVTSGFEIKVTCQSTVGIENINKVDYNLYPNPTKGKVNFTSIAEEISLYDASGKNIFNIDKGDHIDLSEYSSGIYILIFVKNGKVYSEKIILE